MESLVNDPSSSFLGTSTPTSFSPKNLAIGPCITDWAGPWCDGARDSAANGTVFACGWFMGRNSGLCREFEEGDICWFVGMVDMVGFDSLDALSWV